MRHEIRQPEGGPDVTLPAALSVLLATLTGCGSDSIAPPDTDRSLWTWREAYPSEDLLAVGSGPRGFLAAGRHAVATSSDDGADWSVGSSNGSHHYRDVVGIHDGWVAVGTEGRTGLHRRQYGGNPLVDSAYDLDAVASTGPLLLVVGSTRTGNQGGAFTSGDDGLTWSDAVPTTGPLHDVLWDGEQFVAVGDLGLVSLSTDGKSWADVRVPGSQSLIAVAHGDRGYAALSGDGVVYSAASPGNWTRAGTIPRETGALVAVGDGGVVLRSPDGRSWNREFGGLPSHFTIARWTGERFLVIDILGNFLSSTDGVAWTRQEWRGGGLVEGLVEYPGGYLAFDWNGSKSWLSSDGIAWTYHESNHLPYSVSSVAWYQNRFIGVGRDGGLYTSTDGFTWTEIPRFTESDLWSIAAGAGKLVVGAASGIYISSDAQTWEPSADYSGVQRLRWTDLGFLGFTHGDLIHSPDGVTWTIHSVPGQYVTGFGTAGERVYAVGNQGEIASSTNLIDWVEETSGTGHTLYAAAASPECVIVTGRNGTLLVKERTALSP